SHEGVEFATGTRVVGFSRRAKVGQWSSQPFGVGLQIDCQELLPQAYQAERIPPLPRGQKRGIADQKFEFPTSRVDVAMWQPPQYFAYKLGPRLPLQGEVVDDDRTQSGADESNGGPEN